MKQLFLIFILFSTSAFGAWKIRSWVFTCSADATTSTPAKCRINAEIYSTDRPEMVIPITHFVKLSSTHKAALKTFLSGQLSKFKTDENLQ